MEFLFGVILVTEVISALNCVCAKAAFKKHMQRTGLEIFVCFDLLCFCQMNWIVLNWFWYFSYPFLFERCRAVFFLTVLCFFASFCSRFCSVVEPHDATLEVDTEQLVKPYLLSTTAFCHWLYAHMCLSPISAIILELREERNLRCWFVLFCFPCLGFYKRAENRFWPAMAWTVYCSCPDMPRDKYAKTFSFIYVQYIQTVSFLHNRKVTARFP